MLRAYLDTYHPDWRRAHRLWSIQVALFCAALEGLWVAVPSLQGLVPERAFLALCVACPVAICIARLTKQRGLE